MQRPPSVKGAYRPEPARILGSSLEHLLAEGVISEIIGRLKSGKEADVYAVRQGGKVVAAKPTLPIDDAVVKEVWGHLPDKLRQQVSQYYKEQFMPKYSELLKQYYSSLANAPQKP